MVINMTNFLSKVHHCRDSFNAPSHGPESDLRFVKTQLVKQRAKNLQSVM